MNRPRLSRSLRPSIPGSTGPDPESSGSSLVPAPISVIVPAWGEGDEPRALVESLETSTEVHEIWLITPIGEPPAGWTRDPSLAKLRLGSARFGRAAQMNEGARRSAGEVLLFLHADCRLGPNAPGAALHALRRRRGRGAVAFRHAFREPSWRLRLLSSLGRLALAVAPYPFGDQGLAVRRTHFFELGGFPEVPILEDWLFARRVRKNGGMRMLDEPCYTSGRRFLRNGIARQTAGNLALLLRFLGGADLETLARAYARTESRPSEPPHREAAEAVRAVAERNVS